MPCVEEQTRLSIKNILLATVFSEPSEAILPYAVNLVRRYGSKMSLTGAVSTGAICEIIRNGRVDLVVIGTQAQESRKSDLDTAVEEILRSVPCPMLIIGPKVAQTELAKGELERIAYVTDFTTGSLDGLYHDFRKRHPRGRAAWASLQSRALAANTLGSSHERLHCLCPLSTRDITGGDFTWPRN